MTQSDGNSPDDEFDKLFQQMAEGGRRAHDAVASLYRLYRTPVLRYLRHASLDGQAAEDVLHNVFIKLAQRAQQWRGEGSSRAWFWAIVRNAKIDHFRAPKDEQTLDDDGWTNLAELMSTMDEGPHASSELQRCVTQALQRFAKAHPDRAAAIRLMHLEDWSIAQVAQYLERTPGATKEFLSQCRKLFRSFVEPCLVWVSP
jgi:RNA polymerase sigma-70 factor (ECF subfamily)